MNIRIKKLLLASISLILAVIFSFSVLAEELVQPPAAPVPHGYKLSSTLCVYNGKTRTPKVTVTQKDGQVIDSEYYTVSYSNNKNPGKATVTVKMKGSGLTKKLYFKIAPKKAGTPSVSSIKQKQFTVLVAEDLTSTGYLIRYSSKSNFKTYKETILDVTKEVRKTVTTSKNGYYYVKVRNYKMVDRKRLYGDWSKTVKVAIKSSSAHPKLPTAMLESYVADSLTYIGYKTEKHKAMGSFLQDRASGPRTPMSVRSGIRYGGGPNGQETVKSSKTVSGKAPNISYFKRNGMCCASFVSYYYLNYLPNVAGVDTTYIKKAINKSGYASRVCEAWAYAGKYLVSTGKATIVDKVPNGSTLRVASLEKLEIGDLICFRIPSTGRACGHVAVYAGKNNEGDHFVAHVGSDEGPVYQTLQRFQNVVNRHDGCAYSVVYRFKNLPNSKYDYSVKLKSSTAKYTGKALKPQVIVKDATGKTIATKYYTVHYSNNVKVGTATARVVFKGKYKGSKVLNFKIKK